MSKGHTSSDNALEDIFLCKKNLDNRSKVAMNLIAKRAFLCLAAVAIAAAGMTAAVLGLIGAMAIDPLLHSPYNWKSTVIGATCLGSILVSLFASGKILQHSMSLKR